jgi:nitroimidazol reductase NimA-like FMN-containing flavoprotein (pyridoxamine 5'-phosphate oxidase superfamily)
MTLDECETLLRHTRIGRLAVRDAEGTYVVPIGYAYGDGAIYGHSPPGHKLTLLRRWPHVTVLVDDIGSLTHWRSVMVKGRWHELEEEDEKFRARALLLRAFDGQLWSVTAGHGRATTLADAVVYRIAIEEMSGRTQGH